MASAAGGLTTTQRTAHAVDARLRWLGHSTVLVELPGLTFLTDPLFSDRLGPLRRHGPTPRPADLPPLDLVLVSHAHPDHLERGVLRHLPGDPAVLVPSGLGSAVRAAAPGGPVRELRLGEAVQHGPWRIAAVRARHWRWPFNPGAAAIGYLIEGPVGIWFAGDTSVFAGMRELAGRVDLALLPIGRWGPHQTPGHLTPDEAAGVAGLIGAQRVLPIHWGTLYPRGLERVAPAPLRGPAGRFLHALEERAPDTSPVRLEPGAGTTVRLGD